MTKGKRRKYTQKEQPQKTKGRKKREKKKMVKQTKGWGKDNVIAWGKKQRHIRHICSSVNEIDK